MRSIGISKLLGRFNVVPLELLRIQRKETVTLRPRFQQNGKETQSYDIMIHEDGLVHPSPASGMWEGPNGMTLRPPFSSVMSRLIDQASSRDHFIFRIPQGVTLPPSLILLHEHTDHYSLQPTVKCTLEDFNATLTNFLHENAEMSIVIEFLRKNGTLAPNQKRGPANKISHG